MLKQYVCTMRYFIGEYLLIEPIKIKDIIRCLKNVAIDTSHAKRIEEELEVEFVISVQTPSTCMNSQTRGWILVHVFPA